MSPSKIADRHAQQHHQDFLLEVKRRSDKLTNIFLVSYFVVGLVLAMFYDTWTVAIGVGAMALAAYYGAKLLLPKSDAYQYVLGAVVGVFMAQFIYQMHGLFEMHFFAFIGSAILITYQNWKLQIPLAVVVVVHHATFGYLQFMGAPGVFFTELDYMSLGTFIIHALLATVIFFICGLWAFSFRRASLLHMDQSFAIGTLEESNRQKELLLSMANDLNTSKEHNRQITESIEYTRQLRQAMMPDPRQLTKHFAEAFLLDRPQNIVGGDFFWFQQAGDEMLVACVDCTGHGVPGAFLSLIAVDLLNKLARESEYLDPGAMLLLLDADLAHSIGQYTKSGVLDGMDMTLCKIDMKKGRMLFAGAMNPVIVASANGITVYKGSHFGLGAYLPTYDKKFETREILFEPGDMLYLFSDGYADQHGGGEQKKLNMAGLQDILKEVHTLPTHEQGARLAAFFDDWKGALNQTDDMLMAGIQLRSAGAQAAAKVA